MRERERVPEAGEEASSVGAPDRRGVEKECLVVELKSKKQNGDPHMKYFSVFSLIRVHACGVNRRSFHRTCRAA